MKITIPELLDLFQRSVDDESLTESVRRFAGRLLVLTRHTGRIGTALTTALQRLQGVEAGLAELTALVMSLAQAKGAAAAPSPAPAEEAPTADDLEQAMVDQVLAETEAEVAAVNGAPPSTALVAIAPAAPATVTTLRQANSEQEPS